MPNRSLTPNSFLQEFYPEAEIKEEVIINVKDDFFVQPFLGGPHRSKLPRDVRHVDTAGRPQFTATEERVIEINESRGVYHEFLKEKMDNVPNAFRDDAKKLLDSYQREIARKSKPRAILSDRGYFAVCATNSARRGAISRFHSFASSTLGCIVSCHAFKR